MTDITVSVSIDDLIDSMTPEESIEFIKQKDRMVAEWEFTENIAKIFIKEMKGRYGRVEEYNDWLENFKL
jgi:hypothetical protein